MYPTHGSNLKWSLPCHCVVHKETIMGVEMGRDFGGNIWREVALFPYKIHPFTPTLHSHNYKGRILALFVILCNFRPKEQCKMDVWLWEWVWIWASSAESHNFNLTFQVKPHYWFPSYIIFGPDFAVLLTFSRLLGDMMEGLKFLPSAWLVQSRGNLH